MSFLLDRLDDRRYLRQIAVSAAFVLIEGCTAAQHQAQLGSTAERQMTVGIVQREIRKGMSQADVATVLGSPNIVTNDGSGRETWIYDKISTERAYSSDSGGISSLILGGAEVGAGLVGAGLGSSYSANSGASATTQKTLTVIIKFDHNKLVRDFAYHSSQF